MTSKPGKKFNNSKSFKPISHFKIEINLRTAKGQHLYELWNVPDTVSFNLFHKVLNSKRTSWSETKGQLQVSRKRNWRLTFLKAY